MKQRINTTKDLATKTDLKKVEKSLRAELLRLEEKVENVDENAKKYRDDILKKLDGVMGELQTMRDENTIGTYQTRELREQADDHEKRIVHLEKPK